MPCPSTPEYLGGVMTRDNIASETRSARVPGPTGPARELRLQPLLTVRQVAAVLQVDEKTIRRFVWAGRIPCVRIGRRIRFDPADVERWVSARKEG